MRRAFLESKFTFDSCHHLPCHQGKCKHLHGHTYTLVVILEGVINEADTVSDRGMVIDFKTLKSIVEERIIAVLDHKELNSVIDYPTAENICYWVWDNLFDLLGDMLIMIEVTETPTNKAFVNREQYLASKKNEEEH